MRTILILYILSTYITNGHSQVFRPKKIIELKVSAYKTPPEEISFADASLSHKSTLQYSNSFGYQISINRMQQFKATDNWYWKTGVLFGVYPHALRLFVPAEESPVGWEINDILSDFDNFFGGTIGLVYYWTISPRLSLTASAQIQPTYQNKLSYNLENYYAIDGLNQTHLIYQSKIKTPPSRTVSFLPDLQIGAESPLTKNVNVSMSFFGNYGHRVSHLGEFAIATNKGSISGKYSKKFYFYGIQLGLTYSKQ